MGEDLPDVVRALKLQGGACVSMGSALNGALLERAAADWLDGGPVRDLLEPWRELGLKAQFDAAVPLRLIGAWHELALSADDPQVAEAYAALDPEAVWTAVRRASVERAERLAAFMVHEPQTNEVRRSVALLGGFLQIAAETGLPLRCFELAASAGLNLSWDRYRYELDGTTWGDPAASVVLDTEWSGPLPPLDARVQVIERAACDRRPTFLGDPDQRRRLMSYIWADQLERLARLRAAIEVALANSVHVDGADAVDWTWAKVRPQAGAATVLYHSVFWTYMPPETQQALHAAIEDLGAQATALAPFAWLRMEPNQTDITTMEVRLTVWPGGDERLLGEANPHAIWVRWRGG